MVFIFSLFSFFVFCPSLLPLLLHFLFPSSISSVICVSALAFFFSFSFFSSLFLQYLSFSFFCHVSSFYSSSFFFSLSQIPVYLLMYKCKKLSMTWMLFFQSLSKISVHLLTTQQLQLVRTNHSSNVLVTLNLIHIIYGKRQIVERIVYVKSSTKNVRGR